MLFFVYIIPHKLSVFQTPTDKKSRCWTACCHICFIKSEQYQKLMFPLVAVHNLMTNQIYYYS